MNRRFHKSLLLTILCLCACRNNDQQRSQNVEQPVAQPKTNVRSADSASQVPDRRKSAVLEYQQRLRDINRSRILGGGTAGDGQFPWQVALISTGFQPKSGEFCGGSQIATKWILTAAHCVFGMQADDLQVFAGPADLSKDGQLATVQQVYPHEQYNPHTFDNDIALVALVDGLHVGQPIMPFQPSDPQAVISPGKKGRVSGWGSIVENGSTVPQLRWVDVAFQDHTRCVRNYREFNQGYVITSNMLCAGFDENNRGDACQGDSGGPLVVPIADAFKLAGIVSWGAGCSRSGLYGVYTNVSNYVPWIAARSGLPLSAVSAGVTPAIPRTRAAWMTHVDWATTNSDAGGSTDCPFEYPYPECVLNGGRACLMQKAIASAKANDCANSFRLSQITQCHSPSAKSAIADAGQRSVCEYLRNK